MRLDVFLKKSLLIKQRTIAQQACEKHIVTINYQSAKSAKEVKIGDIIELLFPEHRTTVRILEIPTGNVSKEKARMLYEII